MVARLSIRVHARGIVVLAWLCAAAHAQTSEQGLASWYGAPYDGQTAASGAVYHQEELTAAHRTLPFGTAVRVHRTDTGASVVVRINDRGPFIESRILDLSTAAARRLGMLESGLAPVALEILELQEAVAAEVRGLFAVQAGSFRVQANAERTRARMEQLFRSARIVTSAAGFWSVLVGAVSTQSEAETLAAAIRKSAKEYGAAFVVRLAVSPLSVSE